MLPAQSAGRSRNGALGVQRDRDPHRLLRLAVPRLARRRLPEELPQRRWFEHYTTVFDTVELNTTFYRLPKPEAVQKWHDAAPPGFLYTLKLGAFGSHRMKLPRRCVVAAEPRRPGDDPRHVARTDADPAPSEVASQHRAARGVLRGCRVDPAATG